ncbi:MAG: hypothetical protein Q8865_02190 [Bacillota bacterium]|nr:hypothetical protein [Bacillota bacterium]
MKIALINGSPKPSKSNSEFMLQKLEPLILTGNEIFHYQLNRKPLSEVQYCELCRMDALVFAFPLYIDAIPSHLFRMLVELEKRMKAERKKDIFVYALINNGFFEGKQNCVALEILQNWCLRSDLRFGQGVCHGAGEMIGSLQQVPLGHGPLKNLGAAMNSLADNIQSRSCGESLFISPNFPRFVWRFTATHTFWNATAKKNGLKTYEILRRL